MADMTMDVTLTGVGMAHTATIRAGVIGAGFMARVHATAIRGAGGTVVAVAASTPERSAEAAAALGAEPAADAQALIAAPIDVVHVCTPNATHAPLALAALAAGHHVVCEKPLATTSEDARTLVDAAIVAQRVGVVPFVYRYHPMVREARARIAAGELGSLLSIDGSYLQDRMLEQDDANWRAASDGGPSRAFADIGSHLCDLIEFVAGERIERLVARTRRVYDERAGSPVGNEDIAAIVGETTSGALVSLLVSQMAPGRKNALTIELHGATKSARFEQEDPNSLWLGSREAAMTIARDPDTNAADAARIQTLPAGHPLGYQDAFNAFMRDAYAAIAGERPDGLPTFADGLRAALVTEAVLESAQTGTWIEVSR